MSRRKSQSLKTRVGKIIAIFSILLVFYYTANLALLYNWGLAEATRGIVLHEAELYVQAYAKNAMAPLPASRSIQGFLGAENVPDYVKKIFPPDKWQSWPRVKNDILYRFAKNPHSESHHHLLIRALPKTDKQLFIYYDITVSEEKAAEVWGRLQKLAIVGGIVVSSLLIFFWYVISKAIAPLGSLSEWIAVIDEDHPPQKLPAEIIEDEIGQVATRLYDALIRIYHSNRREKQFLRNASHELRTPISIIRNALDVLEYKRSTGEDDIDQLLVRIRRAADTMKSITEAILWLAVENYSAPGKERTNIPELITNLINDNQYILQEKDIQITCHLEAGQVIEIERVLLYIALDNLIRNAFQHSEQGEIIISMRTPRSLEIINHAASYSSTPIDPGRAQDSTTDHFGLGLVLVKKITEKQGWQFEFDLQQDRAVSLIHF